MNRVSVADVWNDTTAGLFEKLSSTPKGLTREDARARLAASGANVATTERALPLWLQFLTRFRNPLVIILLAASALSAATGDVASFLIVLTIVTASVTLDFVQEVKAQSAVDALRRSVAVHAMVRRDGARVSLPLDQIVPGDIVELIAGDLVPADARLFESRDLFVNQALLTGESWPAEKHANEQPRGASDPAGASNAVFAGTSVVSGTATILVCR